MNPDTFILTTSELATELNLSRSTVWHLSVHDPLWRTFVVRRTAHSTWWSVQRLREAGILTKPEPMPAVTATGLSFSREILTPIVMTSARRSEELLGVGK